tara:strand:- start:296 stop:598 length:303 start_codon:yes stop_codon:yes gene_type:complete
VANQSLFGPVIGQWDGAMLALTDMATTWTLQGSSKSTAIEKENHLLTGLKLLLHVSPEAFGENGWSAFLFPALVSHIYNANERKSLAVCPLGKSDEIVFS